MTWGDISGTRDVLAEGSMWLCHGLTMLYNKKMCAVTGYMHTLHVVIVLTAVKTGTYHVYLPNVLNFRQVTFHKVLLALTKSK
jgi:hypothetical protein